MGTLAAASLRAARAAGWLVPLAAGALAGRGVQQRAAAGEAPLGALAVALCEARAEVAALAERAAALEARLAERGAAERGLRERVLVLESELERLYEERVAREAQWMEFTRVIAALAADRLAPEDLARALAGPLGEGGARALLDGDDAPQAGAAGAEAARPAADPARERAADALRTLRALLAAEGVRGIDLLELGRVEDGAAGPAVLRLVDEGGVTLATLVAERLRLEGSHAARTLTIVLEDGYARQGDARVPFTGSPAGAERGGERRLALPRVDPLPWLEALPELFRFEDHGPPVDDGIWNLALVQRALNVHLAEDAAAGHYRLAALAGVVDGVLRDVQLEQLDAGGRVVRVLFADRLALVPQSRGLLLLLEEGAQLRDGRKHAFLDGRYRIFLPRAELEAWTRSGLPGLVPPRTSPLARGADAPLPEAVR